MKDSEIVKALKIHSSYSTCRECGYSKELPCCSSKLAADALNLVERLQNEKQQIIKEFGEKLKTEFKSLEFKATTTRKIVKIEELYSFMNWAFNDVAVKVIDEKVKEYAEQLVTEGM